MEIIFQNAFKTWSLFHLAFFLAPWAIATVLYVLLRNKTPALKRKIGLILSFVTVIDLMLRNGEIWVLNNFQIQPDLIPLQVCHLATMVLVLAFWFKSNTLFAIAFCFNFPTALLSIIFAGELAAMPTLLSFKAMAYLIGHSLIVGISVWALASGLFVIDKKARHHSMLAIFSTYILMIPINNLNNDLMPNYVSNYFFTYLPEPGTPLVWFYEWGQETTFLGMEINWLYLFLSILFGFSIYFLWLGLYYLFKKWIEPKLSIN